MYGSRKMSKLPLQKGLEIARVGGVSKAKNFKEMYEALLEFPEGQGCC